MLNLAYVPEATAEAAAVEVPSSFFVSFSRCLRSRSLLRLRCRLLRSDFRWSFRSLFLSSGRCRSRSLGRRWSVNRGRSPRRSRSFDRSLDRDRRRSRFALRRSLSLERERRLKYQASDSSFLLTVQVNQNHLKGHCISNPLNKA